MILMEDNFLFQFYNAFKISSIKKEEEKRKKEEEKRKKEEEKRKKEEQIRKKEEQIKLSEEKKDIKIMKNILYLKFNIESNDLNHDIYLFDKYLEAKKRKNGFADFFQLNKSKIKIFINNEQKILEPKFKPTKVGINEIKIEIDEKITDCGCMFYGCSNIIEADLQKYNKCY